MSVDENLQFCSLHRTKESTYDIDYIAFPLEVNRERCLRKKDGSGTTCSCQANGNSAAVLGETDSCMSASQLPYKVVSFPSSMWESEAHAATRAIEPKRRTDFYSTAYKIERENDEARGNGTSVIQRAEEIRMTRSQDAKLNPPAPEYVPVQRVEPCNAQSRMGEVRNYLDLVEYSHVQPKTEYQLDFGVCPTSRLPGYDFPKTLQAQSKIITKMGTTKELFAGTAKCLEHKTIGYSGHIPRTNPNSQTLSNGHDPRAAFAKAYLTLAVPCSGSNLSVSGGNIHAFRGRGRYARELPALKPKSNEAICRMVEGSMLQQTIHSVLDGERMMNRREDNKSKLYF